MTDELLDLFEVEDVLHERHVVVDGVNDLNGERFPLHLVGVLSDGVDVALDVLADPVLLDGLRILKHLVCLGVGRGAAVAHVELDPKVLVWATGVVAGGQNEASVGLVLPDEVGDGGGGEETALADNQLGHLVSRGHLQKQHKKVVSYAYLLTKCMMYTRLGSRQIF